MSPFARALELAERRLSIHKVDPTRVTLLKTEDSASELPLLTSSIDHIHCGGVLHHTSQPASILREFFRVLKPGGTLYASTGNIAFLAMRLSLFVGQFNYGKRGILDLTHTRLFTIYSFKKLLVNGGFVIKEVHGFGPPIRDMIGSSAALRTADTTSGMLARLWPRLFAFSFLVVAEKADELEDIYARTLAPPESSEPQGRTGEA